MTNGIVPLVILPLLSAAGFFCLLGTTLAIFHRGRSRPKPDDDAPVSVLKPLAGSYEGFDGGSVSRYQASREIRPSWYPTWLDQPAPSVPGSQRVESPAHSQSVEDVLAMLPRFELVGIQPRVKTQI